MDFKREVTPPKIEFPTRAMVMDYIGNPLSAWYGYLQLWQQAPASNSGHTEKKNKDYFEPRVKQNWDSLFKKIHLLLEIGFAPDGNITTENVKKFLACENADPLAPETATKLMEMYDDLRSASGSKPPQE